MKGGVAGRGAIFASSIMLQICHVPGPDHTRVSTLLSLLKICGTSITLALILRRFHKHLFSVGFRVCANPLLDCSRDMQQTSSPVSWGGFFYDMSRSSFFSFVMIEMELVKEYFGAVDMAVWAVVFLKESRKNGMSWTGAFSLIVCLSLIWTVNEEKIFLMKGRLGKRWETRKPQRLWFY